MMNGMISCATITLTAGLSLNHPPSSLRSRKMGRAPISAMSSMIWNPAVCRAPDVHPVILSAEVANPHGNGCSHAILHHKADLGNGEHHLVAARAVVPIHPTIMALRLNEAVSIPICMAMGHPSLFRCRKSARLSVLCRNPSL